MRKLSSVLIVDDNEDDNYIAERSFVKSKIFSKDQIFTTLNGAKGIEFLRNYEQQKIKHGDKFPPSLILLDVNMPVMDGFEFLEAFKQFSENDKYDPVILTMLTSSQNETDKKKASEYNYVKGFISKPFTKEIAEALVKEHFNL